jgi:hypothetical protein
MAKFRKKPVIINAVQWTGDNVEEIAAFCGRCVHTPIERFESFDIQTLEGPHRVSVRDWVIRGVKGEYYPCKDDIFRMTYDEVTDDVNEGYKDRVRSEKRDIDLKISKLEEFLNSDAFNNLPEYERNLLTEQLSVMERYQLILFQRIENF